jgi:autotransporter-associated beta strand protein
VTLTGPGAVVFSASGSESYSGATNVNGGTLTVVSGTTLPQTTLSQSGSSLVSLVSSQTLAALNGLAGSALNLNSSALTVGGGTYAGAIGGGGATLTKTTSGLLVLSGSNSYGGNTNINAGGLLFGSTSSIAGSVVVQAAGGVGMEAGNVQYLLSKINALNSSGMVIVTLAAQNAPIDFSNDAGGANLANMSLGAADAETYSGVLTPDGHIYRLGGGGGTLTYTPALTDSGSVASSLVIGSTASGGMVVLTNSNNSFSGAATVQGGTLELGSGAGLSTTAGLTVSGGILAAANSTATLNASLNYTSSASSTFAGTIAGAGNTLTLNNAAATLVLTASNGFAGGATVTAGTLELANPNAVQQSTVSDNLSGGLAFAAGIGTVNLGGLAGSGNLALADLAGGVVSLNINQSATTTYAGILSGSGGLTETGSGLLALTASNTFRGATTISAGSLQLGGGGTTGSLSTSSAITDNGTLVFNRSNAVAQGTDFSAAAITGSGSVALKAGVLTFANVANTYSGGTSITGGTLQMGLFDGSGNGTAGNTLENAGGLGSGSVSISGNGVLTLGGNIPGSIYPIPNSITVNGGIIFAEDGNQQLDGPLSIGPSGATAYTQWAGKDLAISQLAGSGSLAIDSAFINANAAGGIVHVSGTAGYSGTITINAAGVASSSYTGHGGELEVDSAAALADAAVVMNGARGMAFGSANPVFGSLGGSGAIALTASTAFGTLTVGGLNATAIYSGVLSGSGGLTVAGPAAEVLSGANTYTGATIIGSAGTLQLGAGGATGTLSTSSAITDNGALAFNNSGTLTQGTNFGGAAAISGSGSLTQLGPGLLVLGNSANTFTGAVTVSGGTLEATAGNNSATPANTALGAFNAPGRSITINPGATLQYASGNVTGNGSSADQPAVVINGGTLISTVGNNANYFSSLVLNGGTLAGQGGASAQYPTWGFAATPAATVTVSGTALSLIAATGAGANNALALAPSTTFNVSGPGLTITLPLSNSNLATAASLTKTGTGVLTLSGSNTYSGGTQISQGTLLDTTTAALPGYAASLSASSVSVAPGGAFAIEAGAATGEFAAGDVGNVLASAKFAASADLGIQVVSPQNFSYGASIGNSISGALGLVKLGGGTLTLGNSNSYSGGTIVNNGVLALNYGSNSAGTIVGPLTINPGAAVELTASNALGLSSGSSVTTVFINGGFLDNPTAGSQGFVANLSLTAGTMTASGGGAYQFSTSGATITTNSSTSSSVISGGLNVLGNSLTFNVSQGSAAGGIDLRVSGLISGSGAINKTGNGLLQLTAANTVTGNLTVGSGTLVANLDQGAVNNPVGSPLGNPQNSAQTITVNNGGTLLFPVGNVLGGGSTVVQSALIINAGGIVTNTAPTSTADGNNTIGPLTLNGGTLTGTGGDSANYGTYDLGTSTAEIVNVTGAVNSAISLTGTGNGTQGFNLATSNTFSITGPGNLIVSLPLLDRDNGQGPASLTLTGSGAMVLTAANTYTGPTIISGGTLQLGNGGAGGTLAAAATNTITDNGTLAFSRSNAVTQGTDFGAGAITGSGGMVVTSGSVTLNVANTMTGNITVSGGTLAAYYDTLGSGTATALGNLTAGQTITVGSGAVLQFGSQNVMGYGTASAPTAGLLIQQGGLLLATVGSNTSQVGPLTLSGGTLFGAGAASTFNVGSGTSELVIVSGSAASYIAGISTFTGFDLATSNTFSVTGAGGLIVSTPLANMIATGNAAALIVTGNGLLTLSASNTYSGGTTVAGGVLLATNTAALPGWNVLGKVSVTNSGSTLAVEGGTAAGEFSQANIATVLADDGFTAGTNLGIQVVAPENFSYSANLGNGTLGLMKLGNGTLTLSGSNTYGGPTTLSAGLLKLAASSALSPNSSLLINGGTLDATSFAEKAGSLAVGSLGTLDLSVSNLMTITNTAGLAGTLNLSGSPGTEELMSYGALSAGSSFSSASINGVPLATAGYQLEYNSHQLELAPLSLGPAPTGGTATWTATALSGSWSTGPWSTTPNYPSARGAMAVLNNAANNAAVSVKLDVPATLGTLALGNSDNSTAGFNISAAGTNALTLSGSGAAAQVLVMAGSQEISAPLVLAGSLNVSPAASAVLLLGGNITESVTGSPLTLENAGTLILGGSNSYTGGTFVSAGTLSVLATGGLPQEQSLTVGAGGTVVFGPSLAAGGAAFEDSAGLAARSPEVVPEPGTLALLLAAGLSALFFHRHRRRAGAGN